MKLEEIKRGVVNFVLEKEKPEGGFGATSLLPPTIEDTYFAVKILFLLGIYVVAPY